jgi:hypothetical protein
MAVFKCLQSGNTVEFVLPHDIESMKGHAGYVRIDQEQQDPQERVNIPFLAPKVKIGRPRKSS